MFDQAGLAVSLPARELAGHVLPGSVFSAADLAGAPVSPDLALAIRLVLQACARHGSRVVFVARPEIYADPVTRAWLGARLGDIADHLSLSDGSAVGVVPGLRNHMFLYRLGLSANAEAFRQLARRAPELLAGMAGQVNTAFRFRRGEARVSPPCLMLQPARDDPGDIAPDNAAALLPFYFTPDRPGFGADWIIERGAMPADALAGFAHAHYLPLTEAALDDRAFCGVLAGRVARAYADPRTCLLLRLPTVSPPAATPAAGGVANRLAPALAGLGRGQWQLPRVPLRNVFFLAGDLDAVMPGGPAMPVDLIMPESFDFWRHPVAFYDRFADVAVLVPAARRHERAGLAALFGAALGRTPGLRWLQPDRLEAG